MYRICFFCLLILSSSSANAFETAGNFWSNGQADFYAAIPGISPSGEPWQTAFERALAAWTQNTAFNFVTIDEFRDPCLGQDTAALGDRMSGAGFAETQCGSEFGENVLAITLSTLTCANVDCTGPAEITETDIIFNDTLQWDIYDGPLQNPVQDFERVALHELGHVLGLDHEFTSSAIMQPFAGDINTLQQDDINGANFIYNGVSQTQSIYGIPIQLPITQQIAGPQNSIQIRGTLDGSDSVLNDKPLDIYQLSFENDSLITLGMSSNVFDASLILARVDSTQQLVVGQTFQDENSGTGNDALLEQEIQAGTYWIGATIGDSGSGGSYAIDLSATTTSTAASFESFTSVYGVEVEVNPNPQIAGELNSQDSRFDNRFIDIYQFEVTSPVELRVDARSSAFDTQLFLFNVLENQEFGDVQLQNDDNGGGTNSTIQSLLQPGTYWMGVTSFFPNTTGNYDLSVSVVLP
ncbi:MAG: matrixin family metalloprotease [Pseudomonadales bacterium]|nr:matrixin family metalloprotease [Pseudomonadales bacterium]